MHRPLPSHTSALQTLPSLAQAMPLARVLAVARPAVEERGVAGAGAVLAGIGRGALVAGVAGGAVRLEAIGRAGSVRARAGLGGVALARRGAADLGGRREAVGGTG